MKCIKRLRHQITPMCDTNVIIIIICMNSLTLSHVPVKIIPLYHWGIDETIIMDTIHSLKLYCLICLTLVKYHINLYENSYHQTTTQSMVVHYCSILDPHHTRVHSPTLPRPVPVSLLPPCNQDKKKRHTWACPGG